MTSPRRHLPELPEKHWQGKSKQAPGSVRTSVPEEGCFVKTDAKQLPRWYVPVGEDILTGMGGGGRGVA
jgi:hypothetical protein